MLGSDLLAALRRIIGDAEANKCASRFQQLDGILHGTVTNAEALALFVYSASNGWHSYINEQLWSGQPSQDVLTLASFINSGLAKLPVYKSNNGTVFRGYVTADIQTFSDRYPVNGAVSFPGFTSAAFKAESAYGGNVLFIIRALSARSIWHFSATFHEEEALLPTGCEFTVVESVLEHPSTQKAKLVVILKETSRRP